MKKTLKHLMAFGILSLILAPFLMIASPVSAVDVGLNYAGQTDLGDRDPREIIASVINIALGFLGIIAVVLILLGGFKWMTAQGNDDKVAEAKKLMSAGVIGLVIILSAYGIATFVLNSLLDATGSGNATP